jgi:hypothetical protein
MVDLSAVVVVTQQPAPGFFGVRHFWMNWPAVVSYLKDVPPAVASPMASRTALAPGQATPVTVNVGCRRR